MNIDDLAGQRFSKLTVIRLHAGSGWVCRCDCGNEKIIVGSKLKAGTIKSCGCMSTRNPKDHTGEVFGRWTCIKRIGDRGSFWLCQCSCGTEKTMDATSIFAGRSKSCGCYKDEVAKMTHSKHGGSYTKSYNVWEGMKGRCYNPKANQFKDYGGRGITMCDAWRDSFAAFHNDMGDPPVGMTIERKNNDLGYFKDNCKWATREQQQANTRQRPRDGIVETITHNGETLTLSEWAKRIGADRRLLYSRLSSGWSPYRILFEPRVIRAPRRK